MHRVKRTTIAFLEPLRTGHHHHHNHNNNNQQQQEQQQEKYHHAPSNSSPPTIAASNLHLNPESTSSRRLRRLSNPPSSSSMSSERSPNDRMIESSRDDLALASANSLPSSATPTSLNHVGSNTGMVRNDSFILSESQQLPRKSSISEVSPMNPLSDPFSSPITPASASHKPNLQDSSVFDDDDDDNDNANDNNNNDLLTDSKSQRSSKKDKIELSVSKAPGIIHQLAADGNLNDIQTLVNMWVGIRNDTSSECLDMEQQVKRVKEAAKANHLKQLIDSPDSRDKSTPLHKAAAHDRIEVMKYLIELNAEIDANDVLEGTPLMWATANGHQRAAEMLLAKNADPNVRCIYGYGPLHLTARNGNVTLADTLLLFGADVNFKQTNDGLCILHIACAKGDQYFVESLLSKPRILPNLRDNNNWTPLFHAIDANHVDLVQHLLTDHKSQFISALNICDADGKYALHQVAQIGSVDMAHILFTAHPSQCRAQLAERDSPNWSTPLHIAAKNGHFKLTWLMIDMLLSAGDDHRDKHRSSAVVDALDKNGDTPLHHAVRNGYEQLALLLVQRGKANRKIKNRQKKTPKSIAKEKFIDLKESLVLHM